MYKFFNLIVIYILFSNVCHSKKMDIHINEYSLNMLEFILQNKKNYSDYYSLVDFISSRFLNNPYEGNTLSSPDDNFEVLVIKFDGVDCYTYIDYVQALIASNTKNNFIKNLIKIRYVNSQVTYLKRRHFFSDWYATSNPNAIDVTDKISSSYEIAYKKLNLKENGEEYIPNLGIINREIKYIPSDKVDINVINNMKTGDYIGIYSNLKGLDVSHTGILIKTLTGEAIYRNASSLSKNNKVVDSPLLEYIKNKPGIVVIRSLENK